MLFFPHYCVIPSWFYSTYAYPRYNIEDNVEDSHYTIVIMTCWVDYLAYAHTQQILLTNWLIFKWNEAKDEY